MAKSSVLAPLAGAVAFHMADSGASVREGETLGAVECMKTMFNILSPATGTITWLRGPGEVVAEGEVLAEIEE